MHARAGVMAKVDEVQERMKADMEAMKEQMATMMEAMMNMKKIMKVNTAAVATVSAVSRVELTPPSGLNLINRPTSDTGGPSFCASLEQTCFPAIWFTSELYSTQ